jgi:hypothetical protein
MLKRISERNIFPLLNAKEECLKIDSLFSQKISVGVFGRYDKRLDPQFTIQQLFNDLFFNNWNLRGTFISIQEMRFKLGITSDDLSNAKFNNDTALDYLQFILNCILHLQNEMCTSQSFYIAEDGLLDVITSNSKHLVQELECKLIYDKDAEEIFVQHNNELADATTEAHPEISRSLNEYRRHDSNGDLQRKGEVLCTLYKKLESIKSVANKTEFMRLFSDATFLFDKTGVRHWVEKDKIASKTYQKMEEPELEEWYDKTFDTFIACIAASDYLSVKQEIKEIKKLAEEEDDN